MVIVTSPMQARRDDPGAGARVERLTSHSGRSPGLIAVIAWAISALAVAFVVASLATARSGGPDDPLAAFAQGVAALSLVTVGAILVSRLPRNAIGWLLFTGGCCLGVGSGATGLAVEGLSAHPGSVPGAIWFAWLSQWLWAPAIGAIIVLALVYPSGRLLSARWRPVAVAAAFLIVLLSFGGATSPWPIGYFPVQNPLESVGVDTPLTDVGTFLGGPIAVLVLALAVASLVLRYRRSSGIERAQLKWFAYVMAISVPSFLLGLTLLGTDGPAVIVSNIALAVAFGGFALLPVAIGIAVLRYRLYDIDLVIRRTLVYGALAALLAAAYVGSVLALSAVLAPLTSENSLAVAGSTLVVAALFSPVRSRVKAVVDRRFYRSRYDAKQELADLSQRLLAEVDLDGVCVDVAATIARTLQPASVSVWLVSESARSGIEPGPTSSWASTRASG